MQLDSVRYAAALTELARLYVEYTPYATARDLFVEMVYYGPEVLRFTDGFKDVIEKQQELVKEGKLQSAVGDLLTNAKAYFANYDVEVDKRVLAIRN